MELLSNHQNGPESSDGTVTRLNRPFLSYSNFRKISLEKLPPNDIEEASTENRISFLHKSNNAICRVIRQFTDGRVWIEMGGHELLLDTGKNAEMLGMCEEGEGGTKSPIVDFIGIDSHLSSCIFANKSNSSGCGHSNNYNHRMRSSSSLGGYPERLPFANFCRAFRSNLPIEIATNCVGDDRECARAILHHANIAEHRYRLGLSQILLQREVLEELERRRNSALSPLFTTLQANCRRYLITKKLKNWHSQENAILTIQANLEAWKNLNGYAWWKLFTTIKPLLPIASSDEKERRWREQLAQLELELDELRSEMSRAQLELESTKKAKEMADKWGEELSRKNEQMMAEMGELRRRREKVPNEMENAGPQLKESSNANWANDEKTMDLRRQLNDALDREHSAQQKAQKALEQLKEAKVELEELEAKNERMEKRQKSTNDDLESLREKLEREMEQKEHLERQQFEQNLKESRRHKEAQKELEAKEAEMEEIRIQNQRRIRQLEAQLEGTMAENSTLVKQKNAWQRRSQAGALHGSMVDLTQSASTMNANRLLKRKLAKALALLQSTQLQLARENNTHERHSQIRNYRQQIEEADSAKLCARRAQLAAENELCQLRVQLDNAFSAKLSAEQKLQVAIREKNAATALAQENGEQLQDALKHERALAEHLGLDQIQMRTQLEQIAQLERELRTFKLSNKASAETEFSSSQHFVERQRLEMVELKLRDCTAKLELEQAQRRRIEALLNKQIEDGDCLQQQLADAQGAKEREHEGQRRLRKENGTLVEQLNEAKRREAEQQGKHRQLKLECIRLEEAERSCAADLKLANKRLEILQNAFNAECHQNSANGGGSTVGTTFSSICGGSELGDLEEMLLEEEEEGGQGGGDPLLQFDGANSDTVEGSSSSGAGEIPT